MAEISANEIMNSKVEALEPSARFVYGLRSRSMNSPLSPVDMVSPLYSISGTRQCFEDRFSVKIPHYLDLAKINLPGFMFLFAARTFISEPWCAFYRSLFVL